MLNTVQGTFYYCYQTIFRPIIEYNLLFLSHWCYRAFVADRFMAVIKNFIWRLPLSSLCSEVLKSEISIIRAQISLRGRLGEEKEGSVRTVIRESDRHTYIYTLRHWLGYSWVWPYSCYSKLFWFWEMRVEMITLRNKLFIVKAVISAILPVNKILPPWYSLRK